MNEMAKHHFSPDEVLPAEEIERQAFAFIGLYRQSLKKNQEYREGLFQQEFGIRADGSKVNPVTRDTVPFWHGQTCWEIGTEYTETEQTLRITVTNHPTLPYESIHLSLVSKRDTDDTSADPLIQVVGIAQDRGDEPIILRNTHGAIDAVQRLLNLLQTERV